MNNFGDTTYHSNVWRGGISNTEVFHQSETNTNFAVALYRTNDYTTIDPTSVGEYFTPAFQHLKSVSTYPTITDLPFHRCNDTDLEENFYPFKE